MVKFWSLLGAARYWISDAHPDYIRLHPVNSRLSCLAHCTEPWGTPTPRPHTHVVLCVAGQMPGSFIACWQDGEVVKAVPLPPETLAPTAPKPPKGGPTAASSPGEVTHGITLRGALLTKAILDCVKRVENRHFRMQQGWYVLHTGAKMSSDKSQHTLLASLVNAPDEKDLPHRAIVGAIEISHALSLEQCSATEPWAFGPVCNVIRSVVRLERPVAHRGALSLWRIDSAVLEDVRAQLQAAPVRVNCLSHLPPPSASGGGTRT